MANGKMATEVIEQTNMTKERRASLRKSNKPIMEKRRRARINSCLTQLKSLVLDGMRKDSSQYSKLEKADILEMTVRHLRNVQRQQMSSAIATDPNVVTKYRAGFNECAGEVFRYLNNVQCVNEDTRSKIVNHLSRCLQNVNPQSTSSPVQHHQLTSLPCQNNNMSANIQQTTNVQPLSVQIPQSSDINNNLTQQFSSSSSHSGSSSSSFSSPVMLQQQSTCLLMPGNIQQTVCSSSTSPTLLNISTPITVTSSNQNVSNSFQIVPGNMYNGPVAVYVGQVSDNQRSPIKPTNAMPVYAMQLNSQQHQISSMNSNKENYKIKDVHSQDSCFGSTQPNILNVTNFNQHVPSDKMWRPW